MPALPLNVHGSSAAAVRRQSDSTLRERPSQALREQHNQEAADWDALIEGTADTKLRCSRFGPVGFHAAVDSKAVARTSPIFKEHLGRPLDVELIRPGDMTVWNT